jgi:hypothetical protein
VCRNEEASEALRRAIEAVVDQEAAQLVAEARLEARARVRTILVHAMAQALLERSPAELTQLLHDRPPSEPARDTGACGSADDLGWYVYCIVGTTEVELPSSLRGVVEGHDVRLVGAGELAAVASQVPLPHYEEQVLAERLNDADWLERTARAHQRVLDVVRAHTTLVPMRLCTIYRSEDSVGEMLVRERQALCEALARLKDKTEWGLKMFVEPPVVERAAMAKNGELATLEAEVAEVSPGAAYLRRKQLEGMRAEATDRLINECVDDVHGRLSALAVESRLNRLLHQEASGHSGAMVLNGAYLLEDAATDDFHACVAGLAMRYQPRGFTLEATGPWPPYNFVATSTEAA